MNIIWALSYNEGFDLMVFPTLYDTVILVSLLTLYDAVYIWIVQYHSDFRSLDFGFWNISSWNQQFLNYLLICEYDFYQFLVIPD